jgi:hypothetical protein
VLASPSLLEIFLKGTMKISLLAFGLAQQQIAKLWIKYRTVSKDLAARHTQTWNTKRIKTHRTNPFMASLEAKVNGGRNDNQSSATGQANRSSSTKPSQTTRLGVLGASGRPSQNAGVTGRWR